MDFEEACREARKLAFSFSDPLIVHHYDTDGITSGAIVTGAFIDENRKHRRMCIKKLDDFAIESLAKEKEIIFVDLGGGNKRVNELKDVLIIDHHQTEGISKPQVNPLLYELDGSTELSASGTAYFIFRKRVELAVTGAVGDMQTPFVGKNKELVREGEAQGRVKVENDLCFYGRYSRPLVQFLEYSDEPYLPGISYREDKCIQLIQSLGIPVKDGERYRRYADLSVEEKTKLVSALAELLAERGRIKDVSELIKESYVFPKNRMNETYEAGEFSTMLNACGRHGKDEVGVGVALGMEEFFGQARGLLQLHRRMLKDGVAYASAAIQDMGAFYLIDGRGVIEENIIGIICGMVLQPLWKKPIVGIANSTRNQLKISTRGKGGNLGLAIKAAAGSCGGVGGGHRMAAGASIPDGRLDCFLLSYAENLEKFTSA